MAVDLTTGSYDEEGVFSKHNETSVSKKFSLQDTFCSLKNFRTARVIKECHHEKMLVVEGHFLGDDKPAIIVIEKSPFVANDLSRIFNADCRLELKFRNNIYANYHVYPPSGFNGKIAMHIKLLLLSFVKIMMYARVKGQIDRSYSILYSNNDYDFLSSIIEKSLYT